MKRKAGANLFTIEFSSSYEDEEEEEEDTPPPPPPPKKKPIRQITPTRVVKHQITDPPPNLGGMIELSDTEDGLSAKTGGSHDIFTINDEDATGSSPTKIKVKKVPPHDQQPQSSKKKTQPKTTTKNDKNITNDDNSNSDNNDNNNNNFNDFNDNKGIQKSKEKSKNENEEIKEKPKEPIKNDSKNETIPDSSCQIIPVPTAPPKTRSSLNFKSGNWPIYLVKRDSKMHVSGRRLYFSFNEGDKQLYAAKCKSKNADTVYIMKGATVHLGDTANALIFVGNDSADFSLRKNQNSADEILTARIMPPKTAADTARKMSVTFFAPKEGTPARLTSKNPGLNPDGKVVHDFGGRFAIDSVKNAVLVAGASGPSLLFIRKTGPDALEIEARFEHEDLWVFAIGIASFLSKVQ